MSELDEIEDLLKKGEKEKAFERIKDKDTNSLAGRLIERGPYLIENEQYNLAITYFEFSEKIALDNGIKENARKDLADAYIDRGNAYCDLNKYDEAIEDYNKAIELDPNYAGAYNNRGNAYAEKGDFDRAIEDYSKTIELNSEYAGTYNNRGLAYYGKGDFDRAIEDYDKTIELNPDFAYAYNNRGLTYHDLMMYNEAIEDYNKAIELNPDFDIAHASLGNSLYMTEDHDYAEKEYREAVMIKEDIGYAHNGLGLVLSKREAYKNAITEFKKALELNKDADFYNNLGCAYAEYGKGSAIAPFRIFNAKKELKKATQEKNTYVKAHKNLTLVGDLLNHELKIFFLRTLFIFFVFALSMNLFEPITINRLILILTGVATLGMVLFSLDFTKIEIKSLKIAGVVEAEFEYEKPKAGKKALQFAEPK